MHTSNVQEMIERSLDEKDDSKEYIGIAKNSSRLTNCIFVMLVVFIIMVDGATNRMLLNNVLGHVSSAKIKIGRSARRHEQ